MGDSIASGLLVADQPDDTQQILELLALGLTDKAVARCLNVSLRTVERRVGEIATWLSASSRFQLGCLTVQYGLILMPVTNRLATSLPSCLTDAPASGSLDGIA